MTQNDVMQLLIGKDIGAVPSVAVNGVIDAYDDLTDGELVVTNAHNKVLSATSVLTDDLVKQYGIKVIQRNDTELISSDLIKQNNILKYKGQTDSAAAEQLSYIGYNGTSGSIEAANSKLYVVRLTLKEQDYTGFGQEMILNAPYKSDASATQLEVATGVALALANAVNRQTVKPLQVELVCNVAHTATNAFDNNVTIVKGEKVVTCATNKQYASGTDLAVGDYVRFSAAPSTTGALVTDGIYKVTELTSTTLFTVDRPIEEESGTFTAALKGAVVLTAAQMASANLGIKLTGIARTFSLGKYRYSKVSFDVGLADDDSFGDTAITYDTDMSLGHGTYYEIAELEWDLLGNKQDEYRGDFIWSAYKANALSTATYDKINLVYYEDHQTGGVGATPRRPKQLVIALATGFSDNEAPDIVVDVLDAYTTMDSGVGV